MKFAPASAPLTPVACDNHPCVIPLSEPESKNSPLIATTYSSFRTRSGIYSFQSALIDSDLRQNDVTVAVGANGGSEVIWHRGYPRSSSISGRILFTSPTMPMSATSNIGAFSSQLIAIIFSLSFMPTICCIAPEIPQAI